MSRARSAAPPRRKLRLAAVLTSLTLAGTAIAIAVRPSAGQPAPPTVSAGSTDVLGRPLPTGPLRLLAFLSTQPDTAAGPSRSQAVEVVSLLTQYGAKGLTAEIVDESTADKQTLTNTYYDWQLGDVRLAMDPTHSLARRYDVATAPTTILLDGTGAVLDRWSSSTPTAQTAQAISERLT